MSSWLIIFYFFLLLGIVGCGNPQNPQNPPSIPVEKEDSQELSLEEKDLLNCYVLWREQTEKWSHILENKSEVQGFVMGFMGSRCLQSNDPLELQLVLEHFQSWDKNPKNQDIKKLSSKRKS